MGTELWATNAHLPTGLGLSRGAARAAPFSLAASLALARSPPPGLERSHGGGRLLALQLLRLALEPEQLAQRPLNDLLAELSQGCDGWHRVEARQPIPEALDLLVDDHVGPRGFGFAAAEVARH